MTEYQKKHGILEQLHNMVVYEPVAYDKSITINEDGTYQPIVRMDGDILLLPPQLFLHKAQRILALFRPDVWEGLDVLWSINCFPDARYMNA